MYDLLVICLALSLSALLAFNALASLAVLVLWRCLRRPAQRWSATSRARLLFTLRLFPVAGSFLGVIALIIPAYLAYEPCPPDEVLSLKLAVPASISALSIIFTFWRGLASWHATRRLVAEWMCHAKAITLNGVSIPAYRVQHPFPVFAIVGVMRPRLFVAGRVFDSLNHGEISAVVAHETGHLIARDNLKRALMRACRDGLAILPYGRSIERAWAETAEAAADDHAARAGAPIALDLAAALVKIARLVPAGARLTMPMGGFVVSDDVGGVAWRVRRLVQLAEAGAAGQKHGPLISSATTWGWWVCLSGFVATIAVTATNARALMTLHAVIEHMLLALS